MSTFPTGSESSTTLANLIPSLWGEKINDFYKSVLVAGNFFVNRSEELADGGSVLYTPNLTEMTANVKSNATAVTMNNATETKNTLTVNNWYEVSFAIEDAEAAQLKHSYYLQEKYAKNAGYTIGKQLEIALMSQFANFTTNTAGSSLTAIVDSTIRKAIGLYEGGNALPEEGAFFFDKKGVWNQLMGIDKFTLAINAPTMDPVNKGAMGKLYGYPLYGSNNIQFVSGSTGRYNFLGNPDSIHFATSPLGSGGSLGAMVGSMGVRVQSNYVPQYLSTLTTADILYGVTLNRQAGGVAILTLAS